MATASLTMPSPNTTENSLGYFSGLMIVKAATLSVAQIVALNLTIKAVVRTIEPYSPHIIIRPKYAYFYQDYLSKMSARGLYRMSLMFPRDRRS